jgi:acyl-CoA dehydrogenase
MELLDEIRTTVAGVAARHAAEVDEQARFPHESFAALRQIKALSAAVPRELGGHGCTLGQLAEQCSALAHGCSASAMILAMHHIQVACMARHGAESGFFRDYLSRLARDQLLIASVTSEVGTFGDMRSSICALQSENGRFSLRKEATTISYGAAADGLLATCRGTADAAAGDQVLVLLQKGDYRLEQTGGWNTLGMRGTCSPGFTLHAAGALQQVLPDPFADVAAQTMVPYSHVLWSSLWHGIAADAVARAAAQVRGEARKQPGVVPPSATRLAKVQVQLQAVRQHWQSVADEFDALDPGAGGRQELLGIGWALKLNNLKIDASENVVQIVHQALQIIGILGYKNDSPQSIGRHYRDVLSASLMISNERIAAKNAALLLVFKADQTAGRGA